MSDPTPALVWCPFPDPESAREIAGKLLQEKLIACANILPAITSVFEWNGEVSSDTECAVMFKTSEELLDRMIERLGACHPYDTPAIIGWRCDAAHPLTRHWLGDVLGDDPNEGRA